MKILKNTWLILCFIAFSQQAYARLVDKTIAIINEEVITQNEWDQEFETISAELQRQGKELPDNTAIRQQVLEKLILRSILLQEAKQKNLIIAERQVQAALKRIAASNKLSLAEFRKTLLKQGQSFTDFHEKVRQELTIKHLQDKEANRLINVSEQEIQAALNRAGLSDSKEYHAAHILLPVPEAATPSQVSEQLDKINQLKQQLTEGVNFNDLAQHYSSGKNALEGGDLNWRKQHELPTLFADTIAKLKPGEYSGVIRSPSGFHIIHLIEQRNTHQVNVAQIEARHILIKTDAIQSEQDVIAKLNALRFRILQGDDFAAIARANSVDHISASQGGALGWVSQGETLAAFEETMNSMQDQEISEPFKTRFGWHILQVTGHRDVISNETSQHANVKQQLLNRKKQEAIELWQKRLRDEAYVKLI